MYDRTKINSSIGLKVCELRKAKQDRFESILSNAGKKNPWSSSSLAKRIGMPTNSFARFENGEAKFLDFTVLILLMDELGDGLRDFVNKIYDRKIVT